MSDLHLYYQLRVIEHGDPDGKEAEPTEEAHTRHRRWAIEAFGAHVWDVYTAGGWADREPYPHPDGYDADDG